MKRIDCYILMLLAFAAATSQFARDTPFRTAAYATLLLLIAALSERTGAALWREISRRSSHDALADATPSGLLSEAARATSFLLSLIVLSRESRVLGSQDPVRSIRESVHDVLFGIAVLFLSLLLMLWLASDLPARGLLGKVLLGTDAGLAVAHLAATALSWWSLSFVLLKQGLFFRR